jgi:hypothetical protein
MLCLLHKTSISMASHKGGDMKREPQPILLVPAQREKRRVASLPLPIVGYSPRRVRLSCGGCGQVVELGIKDRFCGYCGVRLA